MRIFCSHCLIIQVSFPGILVLTARISFILPKDTGGQREGWDCLQHFHLFISEKMTAIDDLK